MCTQFKTLADGARAGISNEQHAATLTRIHEALTYMMLSRVSELRQVRAQLHHILQLSRRSEVTCGLFFRSCIAAVCYVQCAWHIRNEDIESLLNLPVT